MRGGYGCALLQSTLKLWEAATRIQTKWAAEFVATTPPALLGDRVVAKVHLHQTKAHNSDWLV